MSLIVALLSSGPQLPSGRASKLLDHRALLIEIKPSVAAEGGRHIFVADVLRPRPR